MAVEAAKENDRQNAGHNRGGDRKHPEDRRQRFGRETLRHSGQDRPDHDGQAERFGEQKPAAPRFSPLAKEGPLVRRGVQWGRTLEWFW